MSKAEAREVAVRRLAELRMESYESLKGRWLDKPDCEEIVAASGTVHQVEVEAIWDDPEAPNGNLRVWISVGGRLMPSTVSFIIAPDGSFIGE